MEQWERELRDILGKLEVGQGREGEGETSFPAHTMDEPFFLMKDSLTHRGVFYRGDLLDTTVEIRLYLPCEERQSKMQCYLVRFNPGCFYAGMLTMFLSYQGGSAAYREIEHILTLHQMNAAMEMLEMLFWQGNLFTATFPDEILVICLDQG